MASCKVSHFEGSGVFSPPFKDLRVLTLRFGIEQPYHVYVAGLKQARGPSCRAPKRTALAICDVSPKGCFVRSAAPKDNYLHQIVLSIPRRSLQREKIISVQKMGDLLSREVP